jgi:hypothetical protein
MDINFVGIEKAQNHRPNAISQFGLFLLKITKKRKPAGFQSSWLTKSTIHGKATLQCYISLL